MVVTGRSPAKGTLEPINALPYSTSTCSRTHCLSHNWAVRTHGHGFCHSPNRSQERCRAHFQVAALQVEGCGGICWGLCRLCSHQNPHKKGMTESRTCCLHAVKGNDLKSPTAAGCRSWEPILTTTLLRQVNRNEVRGTTSNP